MATSLALDPRLLDQVLELSGESTKQAAVTLALKEFVARRDGSSTAPKVHALADALAGAVSKASGPTSNVSPSQR